MAPTKAAFGLTTRTIIAACAALVVGGGLALPAAAQNYPITPGQRATAEQVAQAGVPLSELAPDAPDSYTVKSGDTRTVGMPLSALPGGVVRRRAMPPTFSRYNVCPG